MIGTLGSIGSIIDVKKGLHKDLSKAQHKLFMISLPLFVFSVVLITSQSTFAAVQLDPSDTLAKWYVKALFVNPNNLPALIEKGTDLVATKNPEQAITWLDKALNIDPNNVMALVSKGAALRDQGRYSEAIGVYDRVLAIDPSDIYAIGGKADSLFGSGHQDQAIIWIDKALELNPGDWKIQQVKDSLQAMN